MSGPSVSAAAEATGSAGPPPVSEKHVSWIEVEHGAYSGMDVGAQHYTVTLFANGRVIFDGRDHVKAIGRFIKEIPSEKVAAIFSQIEAIGFWDLKPDGSGFPDVIMISSYETPKQNLTVSSNGKFRIIWAIEDGPPKLMKLLSLIEQTADVGEWTGPSAPADSSPATATLIALYDRNRNMRLDPEEILQARIDLLARFDANHDGRLDSEEVGEMPSRLGRAVLELLDQVSSETRSATTAPKK